MILIDTGTSALLGRLYSGGIYRCPTLWFPILTDIRSYSFLFLEDRYDDSGSDSLVTANDSIFNIWDTSSGKSKDH